MTHCEGSTHSSADWTPLAKGAAVDCFTKLQQWPITCERKRLTESDYMRVYIYSEEPHERNWYSEYFSDGKASKSTCCEVIIGSLYDDQNVRYTDKKLVCVYLTQTLQWPSPVHPKILHNTVTDGWCCCFDASAVWTGSEVWHDLTAEPRK